MPKTIVYEYAGCGTCRQARKWLAEHRIEAEFRPVRERPPSTAEIVRMLEAYDGEVRRLFNTSSQDYRAGGFKERIGQLDRKAVVAALQANGNLVKRPFVLAPEGCVVGFKPDEWSALFGC